MVDLALLLETCGHFDAAMGFYVRYAYKVRRTTPHHTIPRAFPRLPLFFFSSSFVGLTSHEHLAPSPPLTSPPHFSTSRRHLSSSPLLHQVMGAAGVPEPFLALAKLRNKWTHEWLEPAECDHGGQVTPKQASNRLASDPFSPRTPPHAARSLSVYPSFLCPRPLTTSPPVHHPATGFRRR